jgi:hypothetical protein
MTKILVIQPHKMLQQAMALSLFPQYQARMTPVIPEAAEIEDVDAIIIDAASLRETHGLTAEGMVSLQRSKVPVIWIDGGESQSAPTREKVVVIKRTVERQSLQKAVAECLSESAKEVRKEMASALAQEPRSTAHAAVNDKRGKAEVIELVDVVQESPEGKKMAPN